MRQTLHSLRLCVLFSLLTLLLLLPTSGHTSSGLIQDITVVQSPENATVFISFESISSVGVTLMHSARKIILYLNDAHCPPGRKPVKGDGTYVKEVRWDYKPQNNNVKVVIELLGPLDVDKQTFKDCFLRRQPQLLSIVAPVSFKKSACAAQAATPPSPPTQTKPIKQKAASSPIIATQNTQTTPPTPNNYSPTLKLVDRSKELPVQLTAKPVFSSTHPIPLDIRQRMVNVTWREACPLSLEELSYVTITHVDYDGNLRLGHLVVHKKLAEDVIAIFKTLLKENFPIQMVHPMYHFAGDDNDSMAVNNTSAFNCRVVQGQKSFSKHSWGIAIDINPLVNPYVKGAIVLPPNAQEYANRTKRRKGMITKDEACYQTFINHGWEWGGQWKTLKDYQHFEKKLP